MEGLNYWCEKLLTKEQDARKVASGFAYSKEMAGKTKEQQVEALYQMYLGRNPDPQGKAYWLDKLNKGAKLEDIVYGFAYSDEFKKIMEDYGL